MSETPTEYKDLNSEPILIQAYRLLRQFNPKQFIADYHQGVVKVEAQYGDTRRDSIPQDLIAGLKVLGVEYRTASSGWIIIETKATEEEVLDIRKRNLPYFLLY